MRAGSLRGAPLIINGPIEYRALRHAKHIAFFVWSAVINLHMRTLLSETPIIYLFQLNSQQTLKLKFPVVSLIVSCHLGRLGEYWWYSARSQSQEI